MSGYITVHRLKRSGNYVSDLDQDRAFISKANKNRFFKMLVAPIENSDGRQEIRYMKTEEGILVSGEAYICSGETEDALDRNVRKLRVTCKDVLLVEVDSEDSLW